MKKVYIFSILIIPIILTYFIYSKKMELNKSVNYSNNFDQILETSLTKINMSIRDLHSSEVDKIGGGLFTLRNNLIFFTRTGKFFYIKNDEVLEDKKLSLNLGIENLDDNFKLSHSTFRLHKVIFSESCNCLFATHDYFNSKTKLPEFRLSTLDLSNNENKLWKVLFSSEPIITDSYVSAAGGGGLIQDGNFLYIAIGDYNMDGVFNKDYEFNKGYIASQDQNGSFGKIYKFDLTNFKYHKIVSGLRNPQSLFFDQNDGLSLVQHGPQGGDNLIFVKYDKNYGWPYQTEGTEYGKYSWPKKNTTHTYEKADFYFVPSIGPSAHIKVKDFYDSWQDNYLITSLKSRTLYRLMVDDKKIKYVEPIFIGHKMRAIVEHDQRIYILTDNHKLLELKINPSNVNNLHKIYASMHRCVNCHSFNNYNKSFNGPPLNSILRNVASLSEFNYSEYLLKYKKSGLTWNANLLKKFLNHDYPFSEKENHHIKIDDLHEIDLYVDLLLKETTN